MIRDKIKTRWLINGVEGHSLPADDRGLAYGDGLFETMRAIDARIPLFDGHKARLTQSCEYLGIPLDEALFAEQVQNVLSWLDKDVQYVIKAIVTRGGVATGYRPENKLQANLYLRISPMHVKQPLSTSDNQTLSVQLCSRRLAVQPDLAGLKHLNRLEQVLAARELDQQADEGILLNSNNQVIEAISSNLIAVIDGRLCFPLLSDAGVKGVMQDCVAHLAANHGLATQTQSMNLQQLYQASEILLCNAVRGVRDVGRIGDSWQSRTQKTGALLRTLIQQELGEGFFSF